MPKFKYENDDGGIHTIRLSAARGAVAGTPPAGAVTEDVSVQVSRGAREYGLRPRGVVLTRLIGTAPDQFTRRSFLPVLTKTAYESEAFAKEKTLTIGSVTWTIADKKDEDEN